MVLSKIDQFPTILYSPEEPERILVSQSVLSDDRGPTRFSVYDVSKRAVVSSLAEPMSLVHNVAFSPDKQRVALVNDYNFVTVWDCNSGKRSLAIQSRVAVHTMLFNPNDEIWLADGLTSSIVVYSSKTGKELRQMKSGAMISNIVFNAEHSAYLGFDVENSSLEWRDAKTGAVRVAKPLKSWAARLLLDKDKRDCLLALKMDL